MAYLKRQIVSLAFSPETGAETTLLKQTKSLCYVCDRTIPAKIVESAGKVYISKACCGRDQTVLVENSAEFYRKMAPFFLPRLAPISPSIEEVGKTASQSVCLFVTPKCNASCPVCVANWEMGREKGGAKRAELSAEDVSRYLRLGSVSGKEMIITGGEPTVNPEILEILSEMKRAGNINHMYTNGKKLVDRSFVRKLKEAGLDYAQLSFDSFNDKNNLIMNGEPLLKTKLRAIDNLEGEGVPVVLSPTIVPGLNEGEIGKFLEFSSKRRGAIRQLMLKAVIPIGKLEIPLSSAITCSDIIREIEVQSKGKVSEEDFSGFMRMRRLIFSVLDRVFGPSVSWKFAWGTGYTLLLRVDGKGGYEPFIPRADVEKTCRAMEWALKSRTKTGILGRLALSLPELLTKEKLALVFASLGSGMDRLKIVRGTKKGIPDLLQLHVADPGRRITIDFSRNTNCYNILTYSYRKGSNPKVRVLSPWS